MPLDAPNLIHGLLALNPQKVEKAHAQIIHDQPMN
jgi:hypothetical protein